MAKVVITLTDGEDGVTDVTWHSDPPVDTQNMDEATDAQLLGLGFIAETVQAASSITNFSSNNDEVNLD